MRKVYNISDTIMVNQLFKSMGFNKGGIDAVFLYVLEAVSAISKFEKSSCKDELDAAKCRIFWRTLREITRHEIEEDDASAENIPFKAVWKDFPDKEMKKDMPMHFAVSVPDINVDDIDLLYERQPESIKQECKNGDNLTLCHLAVIAKDPDMDLIERLKEYDPTFGRSITKTNKSTYIHLAAECSNNMKVIMELISIFPEALEMRDSDGFTPLLRCLTNQTPEAPDILQAIVDAAPQTASRAEFHYDGAPPLHFLFRRFNEIPDTSTERMVPILLGAFPEAANIPDRRGWLPIHKAARSSNITVMKELMEANPGYELDFNAAFAAAEARKWDNLRYIHSIKPELFTTQRDYPLLHVAMNKFLPLEEVDFLSFFHGLVSLSLDAARLLNINNGNNLLHVFMYRCKFEWNTAVAVAWDTLRFLLRLIPEALLATNDHGQTPYDVLDPSKPHLFCARRLLLLAGAPSLHPETLKQMNYEARKGGLLAFFGTRGEGHSSGRVDICYRIRLGAGAMELIRQIVSFL